MKSEEKYSIGIVNKHKIQYLMDVINFKVGKCYLIYILISFLLGFVIIGILEISKELSGFGDFGKEFWLFFLRKGSYCGYLLSALANGILMVREDIKKEENKILKVLMVPFVVLQPFLLSCLMLIPKIIQEIINKISNRKVRGGK